MNRTAIWICASLGLLGFLLLFEPYRWNIGIPTSTFSNFLDINGDGEVSRYEWQSANPVTSIHSGSFYTFETSDCDGNGRLNWGEYFDGKIRKQECNISELARLAQAGPDGSSSMNTKIFTAEEYELVFDTPGLKYSEMVDAAQALFPDDINEEITLSPPELLCGRIESRMLSGVASQDIFGVHGVVECELANPDPDSALTLLLFELNLRTSQGVSSDLDAKSLYLPPDSEKKIYFILEDGTVEAEIAAAYAKGMQIAD